MGAAWAQSTIVVTGARVPIPLERSAADMVVIDAERIAASSADSLEDLLRREAGLQLSRNGGPGASASVLMRGANGGHTLVLLDGVRIGSASAGLTEFEGLSLAHVERIEVLRGPASTLYGADAVGGVVQIFTRRGEDGLQAQASIGAGGAGAAQATAAVQWGNGALDAALSFSDERLDGVSALRAGDLFGNHNPDRDGFRRRSAAGRFGVQLGPLHRASVQATTSRLNAQYDGSEFLPPDYAQDNRPDFRNRLVVNTLALEHRGRWSADWRTELRLSRQSSDLVAGARAPDRFRTDRRHVEWLATWTPSGTHQVTLALSDMAEAVRSSSYQADVERTTRGAALAWVGSFERLTLQAEGRHDDIERYGGVDTGRLGASWRLGGGWRVRGLVGTTFKATPFNDLYFPGYGVPTLAPERGRSVEAGVEWRSVERPANFVQATVYDNRVRDLVAYEPDRRFCPPGFEYDFGCARNIGRARLRGGTLQAQASLGPWSARLGIDLLDAKDQRSGARLPRRAAHQERVGIDWKAGAWTFGAEALRVGARPEGGKQLAAATLLDLSARWVGPAGWSAQIQLRNATDRDFEPARDYNSLGRQWWLALRKEIS